MAKFDDLVSDHSTVPVPVGETVGGFKLMLIIVGVIIALPSFIAGSQLGHEVGLERAVVAFVVGGLILAVTGSVTAVVASRTRLTTYMLVRFSFGDQGANIVNFVVAVTMFGWFGVNAALFGDAVAATLDSFGFSSDGNMSVYIVIGSIVMTATTIFGFKAIDKLSLISVPILFIIIVAILVQSLGQASFDEIMSAGERNLSVGLAISAVVGGDMAMVATLPDYARYVRKRRQAIWAMLAAYGIGAPIIFMAAAVPTLVSGDPNLMNIIVALGLGVTALGIVIFSTWTTNVSNLYSAGLGLAAIFRNVRRWKLTVYSGVFGTAIALAGIMDLFIPFLLVLGATIPPIAAVYTIHFYAFGNQEYDTDSLSDAPPIRYNAFAAWVLGSTVGLISSLELVSLSTVPAIDSIVVSGISYWCLKRYRISQRFGLGQPPG